MTRRKINNSNLRLAIALGFAVALMLVYAGAAQGASAGWRVLGATGPTNLPPLNSEVQRLAVDASEGSFTLSFSGDATGPLPYDADAAEVAAALNGLGAISNSGSVEVSGGPGRAGAGNPYFVRFGGGAFAGTDVPAMAADATGLGGGGATAVVTTRMEGGTPGEGTLVFEAFNVGSAPSNGTLSAHIGPLPTGMLIGDAVVPGTGWTCPEAVGASEVTCTKTAAVPAGLDAEPIYVPLTITGLAADESQVALSISDTEGNSASAVLPLNVSLEQAKAGVQSLWAGAFDADGEPATAAGGHPALAAAAFRLNTRTSATGRPVTAGDPREVNVGLPAGFVGNPTVTPRCPAYDPAPPLPDALCNSAHLVGVAGVIVDFGSFVAVGGSTDPGIYNDDPPRGFPAQFGFNVNSAEVRLVGGLRSDEDFGVDVISPTIPQFLNTYGAYTTLWGAPPAAGGKAFLTNPTDCAGQAAAVPVTSFEMSSWQTPDLMDSHFVPQPPVTGCDQLGDGFKPKFTFRPSSSEAATGVATTAHLEIDQAGLLDPDALAPPHLKRSVVTLPAGFALNPAAAAGLEACSTEQMGLMGTNFPAPNPIRFDKSHVSCPDASKIGSVRLETPLLDQPLNGTIFLAKQGDNPFNSLIAIYLVVDDEQTGTVLKLPGEVRTDPVSGQLTAVFDNNPQLPFEDLDLTFRGGGPRSTLATPDVCGTYSTAGVWTPWSAPESGPPAQTSDSFAVDRGPGGSPCASSKAQRPFDLGFAAGTTAPAAGKHSPFALRLTRPDGNQEFDRITVSTPPGFTATLKGVAVCSEAELSKALARNKPGDGAAELANPACPPASQVGTTTIAAGVGSSPLVVKTGRVYLTGPYKGAPASLAFVVPAVAGPFDLGVQVVRTALNVNSRTTQVTAVSDPVPQILQGIPLQIRRIDVDLDRPGFTLNPTNCQQMAVTAQVTGGSGAVADLSNRFQVDGCRALGFKPHLKLQLHGGTKRSRYQRLEATLTTREGDANIARATVILPHSEFLAQEHIRTVCTRVQFAARSCPQGSIYGRAEARTPLLDGVVSGPVYLRSSDNPLPDLVAAMRGPDNQPVEVELAGRTDSIKGGIRNTFDFVPDAPVSTFKLTLFGGKKSLLVNSQNLCGGIQRATVRLAGQNGMRHAFRPVVKNDCKKNGGGKRASRQSASLLSFLGAIW